MSKEKLRVKRGITLIALVITIIVMLILVITTITVVLNSGLFKSAKKATTDTEQARIEESQLSSGRVKINDIWYDSMEDYVAGVQSKDQPMTTYDKAQTNEDGTLKENATLTQGEYTAVIPKGFKVVNGIEGDQSIAKGLVIQDSEGNEFVWIPVTDINKMVICQATDRVDATHIIDADTLECKICGNSTKLAGRLYSMYDKASNTFSKFDSTQTSQQYISNSGIREPDVVTGSSEKDSEVGERYDAVNTNLTIVLEEEYAEAGITAVNFKNQLQSEFNSMVKSVAKYKGFYVGRYEMSYETKAQSKKEKNSVNNKDSNPKMWYGLYKRAKSYTDNNSQLGVTGEMIWGCQYDAMLLWMEYNKIDVTSKSPMDPGRNKNATCNNTKITGSIDSNDILNNIYDLLGNRLEWTQGVLNNNIRMLRGGGYDTFVEPSNCNKNGEPIDIAHDWGTRLALYIKN